MQPQTRINRIDIVCSPAGVMFRMYPEGWREGQPLADVREENAGYDLQAFVERLRVRGWSVRTWPGGARAFLGTPWPIRTTGQIQRMRDRLEIEARRNGGTHPRFDGRPLSSFDLALDL